MLEIIYGSIKELDREQAKGMGLTLEQFYDKLANPPQGSIKDKQSDNKAYDPNKENYISNSKALSAIYWSTNIIFTTAMLISYNVYGAYDSSIWDRLIHTLFLIVLMQIFFLPTYLSVLGIRKLTKKQQ